jgi:hypothetical protein
MQRCAAENFIAVREACAVNATFVDETSRDIVDAGIHWVFSDECLRCVIASHESAEVNDDRDSRRVDDFSQHGSVNHVWLRQAFIVIIDSD